MHGFIEVFLKLGRSIEAKDWNFFGCKLFSLFVCTSSLRGSYFISVSNDFENEESLLGCSALRTREESKDDDIFKNDWTLVLLGVPSI